MLAIIITSVYDVDIAVRRGWGIGSEELRDGYGCREQRHLVYLFSKEFTL